MRCRLCNRLLTSDLVLSHSTFCLRCRLCVQRKYGRPELDAEEINLTRLSLASGELCRVCLTERIPCDFCNTETSVCPSCQPETMCTECESRFPFDDPEVILKELESKKRCSRCFSQFIPGQSVLPNPTGERVQHKYRQHCERAKSQY